MGDTNYILGTVQFLEKPRQFVLENGRTIVQFRAQLPQKRHQNLVTVMCWGNLGETVLKYYNFKSYVMLQGYISLEEQNSTITSFHSFTPKPKTIVITALQIYPLTFEKNNYPK